MISFPLINKVASVWRNQLECSRQGWRTLFTSKSHNVCIFVMFVKCVIPVTAVTQLLYHL